MERGAREEESTGREGQYKRRAGKRRAGQEEGTPEGTRSARKGSKRRTIWGKMTGRGQGYSVFILKTIVYCRAGTPRLALPSPVDES